MCSCTRPGAHTTLCFCSRKSLWASSSQLKIPVKLSNFQFKNSGCNSKRYKIWALPRFPNYRHETKTPLHPRGQVGLILGSPSIPLSQNLRQEKRSNVVVTWTSLRGTTLPRCQLLAHAESQRTWWTGAEGVWDSTSLIQRGDAETWDTASYAL